jgi:hypothetical protein
MSKGSKQRPRQVDRDEYAKNWEAAFGESLTRCRLGVHTERPGSGRCYCGLVSIERETT